ncbi:MAG: hypothetical protein IMZ50_02595, partial [Candidatus Atribacteria bacterium]|nr:hypothetical protein [Candidatus Atribacteria bacterium]
IDTALAVNLRDNGYSGVKAKLESQRIVQDDAFDASVFRIKSRLKAATARDQAKSEAETQAQLATQAELSAKMKVLALREWTQTGGTASEFEGAWPEIRGRILQEKAAQAITRVTASNIRL